VVRKAVFVKYFGGLGNQLFQYNFSKYLSTKIEPPVVLMRSRKPSRADRPYDLDDFLSFNNEVWSYPPLSRIVFTGPLSGVLATGMDRVGLRNASYTSDPFSIPALQISKGVIPVAYSGYFQNYALVGTVAPTYAPALLTFLYPFAEAARSRLGISPDDRIVHVRRGDLLRKENSDAGVLTSGYFQAAASVLGNIGGRTVVVTDDPLNAQEVADSLSATIVLGPKHLNTWESLSLFAYAQELVSSNSTLSWWGAFLANGRGAAATMPAKWFKEGKLDARDSLHIPGVSLVESIFR
jgi:hypothetical protein